MKGVLKGHRPHGRGTPQIKRTFPAPVGLIRLACGSNDPEAYQDINDMLTQLLKGVPPRWDVLEAIRDRRIKPLHALCLFRLGRLAEVPDASILAPLQGSYDTWLTGLDGYSIEYKQSIRSTFKRLLELRPDATLADLPKMMQRYREECRQREVSVMFTRSKAMVQSFVRSTLGKQHRLYLDITALPLLPNNHMTVRRAQRPETMAVLLAKLPEPHCRMAWSMAVTGLGPKEYWGRWSTQQGPGRVHIQGTKRKARVRDVPLWAPGLPVQPTRSRGRFTTIWNDALDNQLGIYDLRRSFAVWMEDAEIPRSRRKLYLGHAAGDVTSLYETRDLRAWLEEDAERLRRFAGHFVPTPDNGIDCPG